MTTGRRLILKKETLSDLTTGELRGIVGGQNLSGTTCPLRDCVKSNYNCVPTFEDSCIGTCVCTPG